jgi:hypothetical protein
LLFTETPWLGSPASILYLYADNNKIKAVGTHGEEGYIIGVG